MANKSINLILTLYFCYLSNNLCYSNTDTLQQGQQLKDWDCLTSPNKVFSLKFFGFDTTISPYLGIFYNDLDNDKLKYRYLYDYHNLDKAVWVANRNNPIPDIYGKLMIGEQGQLSILSGGGTVLDLFSPGLVSRNTNAKLLDSGNLVLHELCPNGSVNRVLWQSFDYPTDTLLPGMKLGVNLKTGHKTSLTSWASKRLPAHGSFTLTFDPNGTGQLVILRQGNVYWKSGPWMNGDFKHTNLKSSGPHVRNYYVSNETEQSFMYLTKTYDLFPSWKMRQDGFLQGINLGINVLCRSIIDPGCSEDEFEKLDCRKDYDHFDASKEGYIYMDEYLYDERYNLTLYDCKRLCWSNCSCVAYTYANENRAGCKTFGKMIYDPAKARLRAYTEYYAFKYLGDNAEKKMKKKKKTDMAGMWVIFIIVSLALLMLSYLVYNKLEIREKGKRIQRLLLHQRRNFYKYVQTYKKMKSETYHFTFQSISSATNNFSTTNKLGEGGFGAVYKGTLDDGQEVAVKRLSGNSTQGDREFKNETELIAKLQHINLVKILGCCIDKQEKILVYEYMPNHSLDFFIFDSKKKGLLNWNNRFVIIDGIAQGLLYLHKFSRLRVIHRDLKASNILLDDYMKPKISDFGMAKLFGINESKANTSRVVGTRGYMPPEYMMEGSVSTKTDVFSFGVLLLEIVSGKMNQGSYDTEHPLNLLGLAWELWKEDRVLELMDPVLEDSCSPKQVVACIQVGLLCVQEHVTDRPTMSQVISMLTHEHMHLPEPKQPAFFIERGQSQGSKDGNLGNGSVNGQSISIVVAR
ncbi:G-type lectin S-receptor-like serine/threonine-protein kinase CES101 [Rutidosis leptorrhynchoides]|uniref:G-type lectin S-receptor-like serine/threonine-protein kinase CES101 n=1 Tax=Rutidosis leptorrhynchoides TaxID=125765 RepID=UPI003A9A24A4